MSDRAERRLDAFKLGVACVALSWYTACQKGDPASGRHHHDRVKKLVVEPSNPYVIVSCGEDGVGAGLFVLPRQVTMLLAQQPCALTSAAPHQLAAWLNIQDRRIRALLGAQCARSTADSQAVLPRPLRPSSTT